MDVAVVGGGNAGLEAVLQLMKIASKIYLIEIMPHLKADPILVEKALRHQRRLRFGRKRKFWK
jgi:alkyl hydroperoxide reductase subunit AhpF